MKRKTVGVSLERAKQIIVNDEEKPKKKYRVNIYYDTMYQVEVEAESEEEAVDKARELANDESNEFANEELLSGLCEKGHAVIEVK